MIQANQLMQMTLEERKAYMRRNLDKIIYDYHSELVLGIEDRYTNLHIWIGNEKCLADGGGKKMIYMRIKSSNYSVPLSEKVVLNYLKRSTKTMKSLIKFGFQSDIEFLDEILEITKDMPIR